MKHWQFTLSLVCAAALTGCASPFRLDEPPPVETRVIAPNGSQGKEAAAATSQSSAIVGDPNANAADISKVGRIVYFDFDSYTVKDEYRKLVEAHAKRLSANPKLRVSIEGHSDERGGREYNLALGQKRAEAVLKSLTLLGAADAQLEAVSFGEEQPAVQGSNESAWAQNRRAELKDR
jgi:peptidoglycan-associated lipoprotein